ncbi:NRPS-like enzyme [Apiospora arundinis]
MAEWVSRLEKTQSEEGMSSSLDKNFGMAPAGLEMKRTVRQSPTMRKSGPVIPEFLKQWCKHWDF